MRKTRRPAYSNNLIYDLNQWGEINIKAPPREKVLKQFKQGARLITTKSQDRFFEAFRRIQALVSERKGTLILAWPVTLRNKKLDLSQPSHQAWAIKLKHYLAQRGVVMNCNPVLHNLNLRFFYNSILHTNAQGALLNSTNYANCINRVLAGTAATEINFEAAVKQLDSQEKQFGEGLPPLPVGYSN